jgi:hypothetical protein
VGIIQDVSEKVQALLNDWAEEIGKECDVIKRQRKFTASTLAGTFVFGFLQNPRASDEQLAQMAGVLGTHVTPQAVEQRFSTELVQFLQTLFERAANTALKSQKTLAPLLDRFTDVLLIDSTTISLPAELADAFPGCGGSYGGGKAALKLQVQVSLKTGALDAVRIEPGKDCDMKTPLQRRTLPVESLRIADLGYFNTAVLQQFQDGGVYWLSRLLFGTNVYDVDGRQLPLLNWLESQGTLSGQTVVDQRVCVGAEQKVACRLIAWRLPQEVAARRRQKLIENARRKGRTPSAARLAWCDWMILVTNVPEDRLTPDEARVLYRARWQIELLFKRWKSQGFVAELEGSTLPRQLVRLWARLLAVVLQHWLVIGSVWGHAETSLKKACDAIRQFSILLAASVHHPERLQHALETLMESLQSTVRQNKRKRPSTFELLNNPEKISYALT